MSTVGHSHVHQKCKILSYSTNLKTPMASILEKPFLYFMDGNMTKVSKTKNVCIYLTIFTQVALREERFPCRNYFIWRHNGRRLHWRNWMSALPMNERFLCIQCGIRTRKSVINYPVPVNGEISMCTHVPKTNGKVSADCAWVGLKLTHTLSLKSSLSNLRYVILIDSSLHTWYW